MSRWADESAPLKNFDAPAFERSVIDAFDFLTARGFDIERVESARGEYLVRFRSPRCEVVVQFEQGSGSFMVRDPVVPSPTPWRWSPEFDLHALPREKGVKPASQISVEEELPALAHLLRIHGSEVLSGDFSLRVNENSR